MASKSYQAYKNKIIIEVNSAEDIPFGDKPNQDRQEGNGQTEPDEYFQEGAQVILSNKNTSHGGEHGTGPNNCLMREEIVDAHIKGGLRRGSGDLWPKFQPFLPVGNALISSELHRRSATYAL